MRLSMISRIIQTEVNVICRSEAEADNIDRGLNNSWYHTKAESNNCFIIHLKTSETYKTIKRSLPFCLFYFRTLLGSSCWPRRAWARQRPIIVFFGSKFNPKKLLLDVEHVSGRILRISRCMLFHQSGTRIHTKCIIMNNIPKTYT